MLFLLTVLVFVTLYFIFIVFPSIVGTPLLSNGRSKPSVTYTAENSTPMLPAKKTVKLGEEFKLGLGQQTKLESDDLVVRLNSITDVDCETDPMICDWGGDTYDYSIFFKGEDYTHKRNLLKYNIDFEDTDTRTYVSFIIEDAVTACEKEDSKWIDRCWAVLGERFSDISYCDRIMDSVSNKDYCIERVSKALKTDAYCGLAKSPNEYCLFRSTIKGTNLAACDNVKDVPLQNECYRIVADQNNYIEADCKNTKDFYQCRFALTGKSTWEK